VIKSNTYRKLLEQISFSFISNQQMISEYEYRNVWSMEKYKNKCRANFRFFFIQCYEQYNI